MTVTLIHISFSPWSERVRWALDVRRVDYSRRRFQPLIGEPELRWRLGRWRGPVSVPVLLVGDRVIADGWNIARWADEHGEGPSLFPADKLREIEHWHAQSERGLAAARQMSLRRVEAYPPAIEELMPRFLRPLGPVARAVTRAGVRRTIRKYAIDVPEERYRDELCAVLDELRAALHGPTLLGGLTYADMTMAQVLAFLRPETKYLRVGKQTRSVYGDEDLAREYRDLLEWRDALYATYREAR